MASGSTRNKVLNDAIKASLQDENSLQISTILTHTQSRWVTKQRLSRDSSKWILMEHVHKFTQKPAWSHNEQSKRRPFFQYLSGYFFVTVKSPEKIAQAFTEKPQRLWRKSSMTARMWNNIFFALINFHTDNLISKISPLTFLHIALLHMPAKTNEKNEKSA